MTADPDSERERDAGGASADGEGIDQDPAVDARPETGEGGTDALVARVAAADVEAAAAVEELRRRAAALEEAADEREAVLEDREERIEELESKLKRARADFQNYKKRARQREEEVRERATEDLVERLLDVRDNLVRAVEQDDDVDVREGVEATLSTFDRVLDAENVSAIEPAPGDEVDPGRHEVVHRTGSDRPAGAIVDVFRPGYEMAGKVLRPAQVTVSEPASGEAASEDSAPTDGSTTEE